MKYLLLFLPVFLVACTDTSKQSSPQAVEQEESGPDAREETASPTLSFDSLLYYLRNEDFIPWYYFKEEGCLNGSFYAATKIYENNEFLVIQGHESGGFITHYYLVSIDKNTGRCIDMTGLGVEGEGSLPYNVHWKEDNTFQTVEYVHELIQDPETEFYGPGVLQDSVIRHYQFLSNGSFELQE